MIPYGKQEILVEDIDFVVDVLKSDFLTQGPIVPAFEAALSGLTGAAFVTAVNSATSALHIACLALDLQPDDIVWTVPNTFVASANCALYCGARVDFVDIDPRTLNLSVCSLEEKLIKAEQAGSLPKIVIPVHFAGEPCDMFAIKKLADKYGFKIIEDASHAVGASYRGKPVGSCDYSDITVFSFHPVKIITSGEGGAVLTNCPNIDYRMKLLRSHGITKSKKCMHSPTEDGWYYEQIALGLNYRMTDIHAALGISQLRRLGQYVDQRHNIAKVYDQGFEHTQIQKPLRDPANKSALHLYVIQVDPLKRKRIFDGLRENNVGVNVHYIPVHTQPYYKNFGFKWGDFPHSESYYKKAITLPMFSSLTAAEQGYVIKHVNALCDE